MRLNAAILFLLTWLNMGIAYSQQPFHTDYKDIPRIDVHTHASADYEVIRNYLAVRENLKQLNSIDLVFWINLEDRARPIKSIDSVTNISKGRMLCAYGDYDSHHGLTHSPLQIESKRAEGFIGYKLWFGPYYRRLQPGEEGIKFVNDKRFAPMFHELERAEVPLLSLHIADPNGPFDSRSKWCPDPVIYWGQIHAFEQLLETYPKLTVIAAHGAWLVCQDAQIDYLRYLLSTYPNLYIDLAATFQYYHLVNRENLRDFMITYADRILFGTDIGRFSANDITQLSERYSRCFQILETDKTVNGGFFGDTPTKGLALPKEVLTKIYYTNALRLYPRLATAFKNL